MTEIATLGGGCFWCLEAVYQEMEGILSVVSGYMGGATDRPTYEQVCSGATGHAEVVQLEFDNTVTGFGDILEVFFAIHDPTTRDRQGNDVGTQYRSVIFHHSPEQEAQARDFIRELASSGAFARPIVTQVEPAAVFWPGEAYHQNYFRSHPNQPYCTFVVAPKRDKFLSKFPHQRKQGV
jgi:peptide-methionine (S)-S-oxide reductase